jgi:hypothetical protein
MLDKPIHLLGPYFRQLLLYTSRIAFVPGVSRQLSHKYISFPTTNLEGISLRRGLDNVSPHLPHPNVTCVRLNPQFPITFRLLSHWRRTSTHRRVTKANDPAAWSKAILRGRHVTVPRGLRSPQQQRRPSLLPKWATCARSHPSLPSSSPPATTRCRSVPREFPTTPSPA